MPYECPDDIDATGGGEGAARREELRTASFGLSSDPERRDKPVRFQCSVPGRDRRRCRAAAGTEALGLLPPSSTSKMRPFLQRLDGVIYFADGCLPVVRMVVSEVIVDVMNILCGGWCPADALFSGAQHLLQAGVHLVLLNKLAPVGLRYALARRHESGHLRVAGARPLPSPGVRHRCPLGWRSA
jgi:hypothetical protein